jgi:hypothetical protein
MHPSTSLRVPCPICRTDYQIVPRTHRDLAMSPMTWRQLLRWTNTDRELVQRHCRYLLLVAPLLASTVLAWRWMYGYRCMSERRTVAGWPMRTVARPRGGRPSGARLVAQARALCRYAAPESRSLYRPIRHPSYPQVLGRPVVSRGWAAPDDGRPAHGQRGGGAAHAAQRSHRKLAAGAPPHRKQLPQHRARTALGRAAGAQEQHA